MYFVWKTALKNMYCICFAEDLAARVRSWMFHSIMAGLCQTRNYNDANNICELFFDELKLHFLDKKWIDVEIYDVIFQKL